MDHKIIPSTYKQFLVLAGDDDMKNMILKNNPLMNENELWHQYWEYDNKAPFSNYCSGYGRESAGENAMAKIAGFIEKLRPENAEKVRVRRFVNKIITGDDYQKIGPAIDHFGFFIYLCDFENEEFMKNLLAFVMNQNIPPEYRVIMFDRAEQTFQNSKSFKHFRKMLNNASECKDIKLKRNLFYKKINVHSTSDFLKEVCNEYKQ